MAWRSCYQDMQATSAIKDPAKIEAEIATATAGAETIAMGETLKLSRHKQFIAEELKIPCPVPMEIFVDATAAKGFADSPGKHTRMKHLDVRMDWIKQLRDRNIVEFHKVAGTDNVADFFTKVLDKGDFTRWEDRMMGILPEELQR